MSIDLIDRARRGDQTALKDLITMYQQRMVHFVVALTSDANDYEDLCQTVFVKMVLGISRLEKGEAFEAWLFQIAGNVCRDHLRRQKPRRKLFVSLGSHDAAHADEPMLPTLSVDQAMAALEPGERQLLALSLERSSYATVAQTLNVSVPTLKSRLFRVRKKLRVLFGGGE